jgi:hypothetical protein
VGIAAGVYGPMVSLCWVLGLSWALAQETDVPAAEAGEPIVRAVDADKETASEGDERTADQLSAEADGEAAEEVIVYSQVLLERARREVLGAAKDAGYITEIRRDDRTILRHTKVWRGEVVMFDDGRVEVKRQPMQFRPPFRNVTPASWLACIIVPLCIKPNGQMVSKRRFQSYERMAWSEVQDEVTTFHAAISDFGTDVTIERLPGKLTALWEDGRPLEGGEVTLPTQAQRRAAVLAYFDSRTDSVWGDRVREIVLSFVRAEIQHSADPFSDEEIALFNAQRSSTRAFVLARGSSTP